MAFMSVECEPSSPPTKGHSSVSSEAHGSVWRGPLSPAHLSQAGLAAQEVGPRATCWGWASSWGLF